MFNVGDRVVFVKDYFSPRDLRRHPPYTEFLNKYFTVTGVDGSIVKVDSAELEGAFHWRFELISINLENK